MEIGSNLSDCEFEIIKMIASGLSSEQMAQEPFLSHYTVNTHRGNTFKKTNKTHVSDVIIDLKERGGDIGSKPKKSPFIEIKEAV